VTDDEPALRGVRITRSFGEGAVRMTALHQVSLDLHRGQLALLMGPSGSGKSTLLAILSGLLAPDSGQVLVRDAGRPGLRDLWALTPPQREAYRLRNVGFIFQGYNLFPALTARQQLEMVLRWGCGVGRREAARRSDEMLGLLGLAGRAKAMPSHLSGGEKQRVAIGRALIKNPNFCFADEPTSALDWSHGEQVIELLRTAAHERGATVLAVTHDARLLPYADVVFHLEDGRLAETPSGEHPLAAAAGHGPGEPWRHPR
jgi:putative ABC transport system ATP-binding protein